MGAEWQLKLDREQFLARHWQREPLLIRSAIEGFFPPIDANELAGLALEEDIESRLVEYTQGQWKLHHGPFDTKDFDRTAPWTLLVQAVDQAVDEVAALRKLMDFIPGWRVDDVMVSYAEDGGSVGPHYDNYDVFLLQGQGQRRWQLGQRCDSSSALQPTPELRILKNFEVSEEYLLGPGDILYVPPGVAHWGVAKGTCTTFSIGFRAPRLNDMVSRWVDRILENLDPDLFFSDPGREPCSSPGEILPSDSDRALAQLRAAVDEAQDNRWFGELATEPRATAAFDEETLAEYRGLITATPVCVSLDPAAKLAWQREPQGITVFANGDSLSVGTRVLPCLIALCDSWQLREETLRDALANTESLALLDCLLQRGCIHVQ